MSKPKRVVNPDLLPHPRPCWCAECKRAYDKAWWSDNKRRYEIDYLHNCIMCGEQFITLTKTSSHCSGKCQKASAVRIGWCVEDGCGRPYPTWGKRRRCDEHLKPGSAYERKRRITACCKWCFNDFERIVDHESLICCSNKCFESVKRQLRRYGTVDRCLLPLCVVCEQPTFRNPKGAFCETHQRRASDQRKTSDGRGNLKNAKRRSAVHVGDSDITVTGLRDRDGDHCRACGFKIDFDAPQHHDLAAEIDHVVPLARGGTHTWDNVQLLHGRCNRAKGARVLPERLSLFDEDVA